MSLTTHSHDLDLADLEPQPVVALELPLGEAEALHMWLLKASADGQASLDEPLVGAALATLSRAVDDVRNAVNIRLELNGLGVSGSHLSDEQVLELGRRIAQAVAAGVRD